MHTKEAPVPVVDVAQLSDPHLLAAAVVEALSTTGFLFVRGHGLEDRVERMFRIAEHFFRNETPEEKLRLDPSKPAPDLKEGFNLGYIRPGQQAQATQPLPQLLEEHASELADFQHACFAFCQRLLQAFAVALDLPPGFFSSRHHEGPDSRSILRFLHYPSIPPGAQVDPNRAGAHSDYGSLTLLFQRKNGGEGLQILPTSEPLDGGKWQDTGIVNDALLVNVGDALELWSGARLKSTLHRVVLPTPLPADGVPERFSIAWFNQPTPDASLRTCVDVTSISENDLARMERKGVKPGSEITADEHLQARLASTYNLSRSS
ncbi:hypothetical protein BMF94_1228 [Rhodotorula taiwanensis]|uniref:Fe2OG dioxygenase domain-containing protein n=1 Tax=Rhodotorula taiwanensis TaxID=741276 RepID=A0A2S5BFQ2_9BASI|nr:hypothetical protein BMF94_1228 [Rhodotorula taiwanensis]